MTPPGPMRDAPGPRPIEDTSHASEAFGENRVSLDYSRSRGGVSPRPKGSHTTPEPHSFRTT